MRYSIVGILIFAMVMCIWTAILGVVELSGSSVPGAIAVVVIAALGFVAAAWRVRFNWQQLHSDGPE